MDIKEIVESTLVAPMRAQAQIISDLEALREKQVNELVNEVNRLNSLCDSYRSMNGRLESLLGELHTRFQNKAARDELLLWDEMAGLVREQFDAIHGPNG